MGAAPSTPWDVGRQHGRFRALKREYMRRWRAIPSNREQERQQQRRAQLERKLMLFRNTTGKSLCGFCYQRAPVIQVERLLATSRGFRRIFVPYCGVC
jgi:hypothetical protein